MSNEECLDRVIELQKNLYVLSNEAEQLGLCCMAENIDHEAKRLDDLIKMF